MVPVQILLVEDNEGDILLIRESFEEARIINTIISVKDGEKAIDYLERKKEFAEVSLPDLVLLDVNLPRKNGHEVLAHIKNSVNLKHIPVIMLTSSSSERDIIESYKNHANCYITKPVEVDDFLNAITKIEKFWIQITKLPSRL